MVTRSPHDTIVQRKEDGWSQDFWLSDSESGRQEIARREAAAAGGGAHSTMASRAELDRFAYELGQKFARQRKELTENMLGAIAGVIAETEKKFDLKLEEERRRLDLQCAELQVEVQTALAAIRSRSAQLHQDIAEFEAQKRLKVVR